jgi:release factor glutamine methyltransferase
LFHVRFKKVSRHIMTIGEVLQAGKKLLGDAGIENLSLDAALFLAEAKGLSRSRLPLIYDDSATPDVEQRFFACINRRVSGEPAAYILGRREFRGLDFAVNPAVLIPRPDTETLLEAALEYIQREQTPPNEAREITLLDLCTGSGALAVALKSERPSLTVYASDISAEALSTAEANALQLLGGNVTFLQSDLFTSFGPSLRRRFDIIVSNPPYIKTSEIPGLQAEVLREPRLALDGGADGLDLIRRIIAEAGDFLCSHGSLLLEADPRQMESIAGLLAEAGFKGIQTYRDLAHHERVIAGSAAR